MDVPKSALQALHTPVIYVQGGPTDIAYANGRDDFARIDHVPAVMVDLLGKGHGGTYFEPNGGKAARIVVDWLEWQLRDDAGAARSFVGANCRLCANPEAFPRTDTAEELSLKRIWFGLPIFPPFRKSKMPRHTYFEKEPSFWIRQERWRSAGR